MFQEDKSIRCSFYDRSFLDDLYPYKYNISTNKIDYYDNGRTFKSEAIDMTSLLTLIDSLCVDLNLPDVWLPAFVDLTTSVITNKILFKGSSAVAKNLGIEDAISFNPELINWTVNNAKMSVDWILTPITSPFLPQYGLLFWYKKNSKTINANPEVYNAVTAPYNTILSPRAAYNDGKTIISTTDRLLKKSDDIFLVISKDSVIYTTSDNTIKPADNNIFSISRYLAYNKLVEDNSRFVIYRDIGHDVLPSSKSDMSIWIPDGEMYSHIDSEESAAANYSLNVISNSYLSPVLFPVYREIYHILTLKYKKYITKTNDYTFTQNNDEENPDIYIQTKVEPQSFFNRSQYRIFKKIAYILSTMPGMDRTTISVLNDKDISSIITRAMNEYTFSNITQELTTIKLIIQDISKKFAQLTTTRKIYKDTALNTGLVDTKKDLFYRLLHKYGAKLVLNSTAKLTYKHKLKYGPHVKINQDIITKCDKNINNTIIFNNVTFKVGKFTAESKITDENSNFVLSNSDVPGESVVIPLWDIEKKKLINNKLPISAGPDLEVEFDSADSSSNTELEDRGESKEVSIDLQSYIDIEDWFNGTVLGGENLKVEWTRLSGPDCLKFSNRTFNETNPYARYSTSSEDRPTVYIKKPGKYILQMMVKTSFSIVYDTVTIHATSPTAYVRSEPLLPFTEKYLASADNLAVILPNIRECAFGKQGVFWPSHSDCSVKAPVAKDLQENVSNLPQYGGSRPPRIISFGQPYHKFAIPMRRDPVNNSKIIQEADADLSIEYICGTNTKIEISKIMLTHMMDNNEDCSQCMSLYEGILDNNGFILDAYEYSFYDIPSDTILTIPAPNQLSTHRSAIKSYGGFPSGVVASGLQINIPFHPAAGTPLQHFSLTEDLLNTPTDPNPVSARGTKIKHLCHETHIQYSGHILFTKGYFHPASGWIDTSLPENSGYLNKTSVSKFKENKPVLSFRGLGFHELKNAFIDSKPKIYKSKITLDASYKIWNYRMDNLPRGMTVDLSDQIYGYGYRAGSNETSFTALPYTDTYDADFSVEPDGPVPDQNYCNNSLNEQNYMCSYTMTQRGGFDASIDTLELQLNYLNYINPKELVIWLELDSCDGVSSRLDPPKPEFGNRQPVRTPWFGESYEQTFNRFASLPSGNIKNYLSALMDTNDNLYRTGVDQDTTPFGLGKLSKPRLGTYYLYLSNQNHIYGLDLNKHIKFSDYLDKYNTFSDPNFSGIRLNDHKIAISENSIVNLSPTISPTGYSDEENYHYQNIMLNNNFLNSSHRFSKFKNIPLFAPQASFDAKPNSSSTSFTLCIAVMNESDSVEPYDRLITTDPMIGFTESKIKNKSNLITNSMCSWDLILHKADSAGFAPGDVLGNIEYGNEEPFESGHNFIADFTDKLYLIPPVNLNAPNSYMIEGRSCHYAKEALNVPAFLPPPSFNPTPILLIMPASIVGGLVALSIADSMLNEQAKEIANYLGSFRRAEQKEVYNRAWFVPKYEKYDFGKADKVLLSVSKDGGNIWYKLEAPIFRYDNSLVLSNNNQYSFYRLHYKSLLKSLAMFNGSTIENLDQIFLNNSIKNINIELNGSFTSIPTTDSLKSQIKNLKTQIENLKTQISNTTNQDQLNSLYSQLETLNKNLDKHTSTLSGIGNGIEESNFVKLYEQSASGNNGYYVAQKNTDGNNLILNKINKFKDLFNNPKYCEHNNISELIPLSDDIQTMIDDKTLVTIDGARPYHFFQNHNNIINFRPRTTVELESVKPQISGLEARIRNLISITGSPDLIFDLQNQIWDLQHMKYNRQILAKALLRNDDNYLTLLKLNSALSGNIISIEPSESHRIIMYKNDYTSFDDTSLPFNLWSQINNKIEFSTPNNIGSTWGSANYGCGTNLVRPTYLSNQNVFNQVKPIHNLYDGNKNSINQIGNFKLLTISGTIINGSTSSMGYCYGYNEISKQLKIYDNFNFIFGSGTGVYPSGAQDDWQTTIGNAFKDQKFNVYKKEGNKALFLDIDISVDGQEKGQICFNKDLKQELIYKLQSGYTEQKLKSRLPEISGFVLTANSGLKKELITPANETSAELRERNLRIEKFKQTIKNYYNEESQIKFYLDKISSPLSKKTTIPHITLNIEETTTPQNHWIFTEKFNNNYYWINIDPNQSCSIDDDRTPRILKSVKVTCIPFNDRITNLADQICVRNLAGGGADSLTNGVSENFNQTTAGTTYLIKDEKIDAIKMRYPLLNWPPNSGIGRTIDREFFLNFAGIEKAQLVNVRYEYIYPIIDRVTPEVPLMTTAPDKVNNFFNLNSVSGLLVDFKRIPRGLKNRDTYYDIYEPNDLGQLSKSIYPSPGGPPDTSLRIWQCIDPATGQYVDPPIYYKWLNEMIFRNFFGSVDGIEQRGSLNTQSKDETYWIPYDYS